MSLIESKSYLSKKYDYNDYNQMLLYIRFIVLTIYLREWYERSKKINNNTNMKWKTKNGITSYDSILLYEFAVENIICKIRKKNFPLCVENVTTL